MARIKLSYGTFRPLKKGETGYSSTARKYINDQGEIIPVAQYQRLARAKQGLGPQPSRQPKPSKPKKLLTGKIGSNRLSNYNKNAQRFADRHGLTIQEAKKSGRFQSLNEDIRKGLKSLKGYEETLGKMIGKDVLNTARKEGLDKYYEKNKKSFTAKQQKQFEKVIAKRIQLAQLFRDSGRKDPQDFTILGSTPDAT